MEQHVTINFHPRKIVLNLFMLNAKTVYLFVFKLFVTIVQVDIFSKNKRPADTEKQPINGNCLIT